MSRSTKKAKKKNDSRRFIRFSIAALLVLLVLAVLIIAWLFKQGFFSSCGRKVSAYRYEPPRSDCLSVYVLDVGQGDAAILVSPFGKTMLIDSGDSFCFPVVKDAMEQLGIERLDAVVATHPHYDHIGSMPAVLDYAAIGTYYMPEVPFECLAQFPVDEALKEKGLAPEILWSGDTVDWDEECTVEVLSPVISCDYSDYDANDYSLILRISYKDTAIMMTGDATVRSEQLSMFHNEKESFKAIVLHVAHHGSTTSSSYGFLETVGAEYAVISVGADNEYGHPDFDILNRLNAVGSQTYRTDVSGAITLFLNGASVEILTEKQAGKK